MAHQAQLLDKILLLVCFILFSCNKDIVNEQNYYNIQETEIVTKNGITKISNTQLNGIVYSLFPNRDTQFVRRYKNGKEEGIWKAYYDNGNLREVKEYSNGLQVGERRAYWRGGELKLEYHYKNGVYEGTNRIWNPDSTLIQEMNYHNGQELGSQKVWYNNGQIKSNYIIKDGRRYGLLGTKNCTNVSDTTKIQ